MTVYLVNLLACRLHAVDLVTSLSDSVNEWMTGLTKETTVGLSDWLDDRYNWRSGGLTDFMADGLLSGYLTDWQAGWPTDWLAECLRD